MSKNINKTHFDHLYLGILGYATLSDYDLSGYVQYGKPQHKMENGKHYVLQYYQGIHNHEYTVMEYENDQPNGLAQLFKDGALQQSWFMEDGERVGPLKIYRDGVFTGLLTWECLRGETDGEDNYYREVVFKYGRPILEIRRFDTKLLLYSGGYNPKKLQREG